MSDILSYNSFFLIGIKGVAMTSLAQCLSDAEKEVQGSDVDEDFVTQPLLNQMNLDISSLEDQLPENIDCVIYTAAHGGPQNPQVLAAQKKGLPTFSHAEALADLFNQKQGIAVSGVGGKSTVSAMIVWILEWLVKKNPQRRQPQSFSVGVGDIIGLNKTGQWSSDSQLFVAEADDYVVDPQAADNDQTITPRFSFLKPSITVCTNLKYDHPDVYKDFSHTKQVFKAFFDNLKRGGTLVVNGDDQPLLELANQVTEEQKTKLITYGKNSGNTIQLLDQQITDQQNQARFKADKEYSLTLGIPGAFNVMNALAATAACKMVGIEYQDSVDALADFESTKRRFEFIGTKNQVLYYDDYAHHPHEVAAAIQAIQAWHQDKEVVVAFQSHTYSRTKKLFSEFVDALALAKEVVMIDIFASAREQEDSSVSSDLLCQQIMKSHPQVQAKNLKTIEKLANYCQDNLKPNQVFITLGAGDIYKVHDLITV